MKTISHSSLGTFALLTVLIFAPMAPAQDLPQDLTPISITDAMALNLGRLYRFSTWPDYPPLPPFVLLAEPYIGEDGSGSTTNLFYSASLAALFLDDREWAVLQALQAASGGNQQMSEDEEEDYDLPALDTTQLYLEITNVASGLAYFNLHNCTNQVYAIWNTSDLAAGWNVAAEVWPTNADVMPFTLATLDQSNLFALAQDWTGVTENGNTTPDWWLWQYFGTVALSDTNLDSQGTNTLLYDYTNGLDPNVISFSVSATNTAVNQTTVPVQLSLLAGSPYYYAVLLNDTNYIADASWVPYAASNLTVTLGSTPGVYTVSIGLRGLPPTAKQSWQSLTFYCDTTPLTLALTNLTAFTGSRPFIDPAGYASRALSSLTWTLLDANGNITSGSGMVVAQGWSLSDPYHVTDWFQCVDLPLALAAGGGAGTNVISIQAVDWAGTVAVTNFAYIFDTNGDTTPPSLSFVWPQGGTQVSSNNFTLQAWMDDDTAAVALQYADGNGIVQTVSGLVERGGNVWVPSVSLLAGTNTLSLLASDAAGNLSTNTFSVVQTNVDLTISPIPDDLPYAYTTVAGTVGDWAATVTVNGVAANNLGWGSWQATNVPIQLGGTVTLQATAQLSNGATIQTSLTQERGPIVFTRTYGYQLDFTQVPNTNTFEGCHFDLQWTRGAGGTNTQTDGWLYSDGTTSSNVTVAVWPPDSGYWPSLPGQSCSTYYTNGALWYTTTSTVDPPNVEWMENSASSGSWPSNSQATWTESSKREIRLFTGGSASRQSQGLFDLSASLNRENQLDPAVVSWDVRYWGQAFQPFLQEASPPVAVPPQQISLGSVGTLGSDGQLWSVQPNGDELVITPTVLAAVSCQAAFSPSDSSSSPGPSEVGQLPFDQKYKLVITANGNDLSVTNPEFCVGQKVDLASSWVPDLPQGTISTLGWLIGPTYANTNDAAHDGIAPVYRVDHSLETNAEVSVWWYDRAGPRYVGCTWTNELPSGKSFIVKDIGMVSVYRPSVTGFVCQAPRSFLWLPGTTLSYGDRTVPTNGMLWTAEIKSKYDGRHGLTQVFSTLYSVSPTLLPPPIDTLYCGGADAGEFYDIGDTSETPDDGTFTYWVRYAAIHDVSFQDYPNLTYRVANVTGEIQIADAADYIRFKPGTGRNEGNIYVTLGVVHWNADGSYKVLTGWNANSTPAASAPDGTYGFPFWCSTIHSAGN